MKICIYPETILLPLLSKEGPGEVLKAKSIKTITINLNFKSEK